MGESILAVKEEQGKIKWSQADWESRLWIWAAKQTGTGRFCLRVRDKHRAGCCDGPVLRSFNRHCSLEITTLKWAADVVTALKASVRFVHKKFISRCSLRWVMSRTNWATGSSSSGLGVTDRGHDESSCRAGCQADCHRFGSPTNCFNTLSWAAESGVRWGLLLSSNIGHLVFTKQGWTLGCVTLMYLRFP